MRSYTQYLNQARNQQRSLGGAIIALVCLFSLAAATPAVAATADSGGEVLSFTRADLNNDGAVDFEDLILAIEYLGGRGTLPVIEALDVINDGKITEGDLFGLEHIASAPRGSGFLPERMKIVRGDLNDDGSIDVRDARLLEAYLEHDGRIRGTALDAADLDNNGVIDARDMARLDNMVGSDGARAASQGSSDDFELLNSNGQGAAEVEGFSAAPKRGNGVEGPGDRPNPRVIDYPAPIVVGAPYKSAKNSPAIGGFTTAGRTRTRDGGASDKGSPASGDFTTAGRTRTRDVGSADKVADKDKQEKVERKAPKKRARR
jgi:Ca2+-binding EF-hand superfamily protein